MVGASLRGPSLLTDARQLAKLIHGQRQINKILHTAAMTQVCRDSDGRVYYRRKREESLTHMEALRCLKRQIAKVVWRTMIADANRGVGPGGTSGNVSTA